MSVFNPAAVSCPHFLIKINQVLLSLLATVKEELTKAALSHWQMTHIPSLGSEEEGSLSKQ